MHATQGQHVMQPQAPQSRRLYTMPHVPCYLAAVLCSLIASLLAVAPHTDTSSKPLLFLSTIHSEPLLKMTESPRLWLACLTHSKPSRHGSCFHCPSALDALAVTTAQQATVAPEELQSPHSQPHPPGTPPVHCSSRAQTGGWRSARAPR